MKHEASWCKKYQNYLSWKIKWMFVCNIWYNGAIVVSLVLKTFNKITVKCSFVGY